MERTQGPRGPEQEFDPRKGASASSDREAPSASARTVGRPLDPKAVLRLQRSIGNRAFAGWHAPAGQVAVARSPEAAPTVQRVPRLPSELIPPLRQAIGRRPALEAPVSATDAEVVDGREVEDETSTEAAQEIFAEAGGGEPGDDDAGGDDDDDHTVRIWDGDEEDEEAEEDDDDEDDDALSLAISAAEYTTDATGAHQDELDRQEQLEGPAAAEAEAAETETPKSDEDRAKEERQEAEEQRTSDAKGRQVNTVGLSVAAGVMATNATTFALSVKKMATSKKVDADTAYSAGRAAVGVGAGVSNATAAGSQLAARNAGRIGDAATTVGSSAESAAVLDALGAGLDGVKAAHGSVFGLYELWKNRKEKSGGQVAAGVVKQIGESLKGVKSAVTSVRTWLGKFNDASPVVRTTARVTPGLGLGISLADFVLRAYDLVTAWVSSRKMRARKRDQKRTLGGIIGSTAKKVAREVLAAKTSSQEQLRAAREYLIFHGLQRINDKRMHRAWLKIGVALTNIAGDAAILGGATALVGIALKISAGAVDLGATVTRALKQWKNDRSPTKDDGEENEQSTAAKTAHYNATVDWLFQKIADETEVDHRSPAGDVGAQERVQELLEAVGMSIEEFTRRGRPGAEVDAGKTPMDMLRKELVARMAQRESG